MKKIISGKVREVYDLEDGRMVIVTTDRISAFDVILPTTIEGKGRALNTLSLYWFNYTKDIIPNHLISSDPNDMPVEFRSPEYEGRTMLVKKLNMLPYEVIVRGYMFGSMYTAYKKGQEFLGHALPPGYKEAQRLPHPIVTPSTKATSGHDENITIEELKSRIGKPLGDKIEEAALSIYNKCYSHAIRRGIIIADTKFEFGLDKDGTLTLADEVLTPDSSRFWDANTYEIGTSPRSYDKQYIRDYLLSQGLAGDPNIKSIPQDVIERTCALYKECVTKLVG